MAEYPEPPADATCPSEHPTVADVLCRKPAGHMRDHHSDDPAVFWPNFNDPDLRWFYDVPPEVQV